MNHGWHKEGENYRSLYEDGMPRFMTKVRRELHVP